MSRFYEDLVNKDFYKKASVTSPNDVMKTLEKLSKEEIEALAEELDLFSKEAEETSIEEKATEAALNTETPSEQKVKGEKNEGTGIPSEDEVKAKAIAEAASTVKTEDEIAGTVKKVDDAKYGLPNYPAPSVTTNSATPTEQTPPAQLDQKDEDMGYEGKTAAETLNDILESTASDEDQAIEQLAEESFIVAENMLKEAGYGVADYVYGLVGDEKLALIIADKAEKLATVTEQPLFKVARDLSEAVVAQVYA